MNTSLVVLLIMGIFLASARPEDCNQQSTKEAVCKLQTLVKQQGKPSIGETDFAPMINVISSIGDAGTAGRKAIKADLDKLRKDVVMKADLVQLRKDVAMKADLDKLRKDVAMKADLDKLRKDVALKADLDKLKKDIAIIKEVVEATKALVTHQTCASPWVKFQSSCYLFSSQKSKWAGAKAACNKYGAKLVSIKSQAEQSFVQGRLKGDTWLGTSDQANEGKWIWELDGSAVAYKHWNRGEPNGGRDENFGMLWKNGNWNDCSPNNNWYYICQKH